MSDHSTDTETMRSHRTPALRRRNRIIGLIAILVVIGLTIFSAFYISRFGGVNKGPMKPFHSMLESSASGRAAA